MVSYGVSIVSLTFDLSYASITGVSYGISYNIYWIKLKKHLIVFNMFSPKAMVLWLSLISWVAFNMELPSTGF